AKDLNVMEVMAISSSEKFLQGCGFDFALPDQKKALFCQLRPRPKE
ncbi:MAG: N-acetylglutamate synthase, partial [Rubripirellula sp.]